MTFGIPPLGVTLTGNNPQLVTVLVSDPGGSTVTITSIANVTDAPLTGSGVSNISGTEGQSIDTSVVATFTDQGQDPGATYSAMIYWGDGDFSVGTIAPTGTPNQYTVSGKNTYNEEGRYAIHVKVYDDGGSTADIMSVATIADNPSISATPSNSLSATEGQSFIGQLATFTDPGQIPLETYTASIQWGTAAPRPAWPACLASASVPFRSAGRTPTVAPATTPSPSPSSTTAAPRARPAPTSRSTMHRSS